MLARFREVRGFTTELVAPLSPEDCMVQSMPDVSPTRWHMAHTTWFFETFLLPRLDANYQPLDPQYGYLFNSYYNTVGEQFPRSRRGLLSRPSVAEVVQYREHVDARVEELLASCDPADPELPESLRILEIGLQHEQQHQELMLTDIKHVLSCNPLWPTYRCDVDVPNATSATPPLKWHSLDEGIVPIGHVGAGFCFDNEGPRHRVFLEPCALADRLVTNGEYLEFIEHGGYQRPELWLSLGWSWVQESSQHAPLYWVQQDGQWHEFTLRGLEPLDLAAPVCHVSYFEADAFARWSEARLPTEFEWEAVATQPQNFAGNFVERRAWHPLPLSTDAPAEMPQQMAGDVWEWTQSSYAAYPGYRPLDGALGEYNGKFMCQQYVLRGGSCATSGTHIRPTYRNFFPPDAQWQFTGIRLARSL